MISEKYLARDWSETIRIYSGLLEEEHRREFIKQLAETDILLATECRTTAFAEDEELDAFLVDQAVQKTRKIKKPMQSAKGLLALAELDRFSEITDFFRTQTSQTEQALYFQVIAIFLRNGNDKQIFDLLQILAKSNLRLLSKAMDLMFDLSLEGYADVQKGNKILALLPTEEKLIKYKVACLFEIKSELQEPREIFYSLLLNKQLKYAERLGNIANIVIDNNITKIFNRYIIDKEPKEILEKFIFILKNINGNFDSKAISIFLSKSLNPKIKELGLIDLNGNEISKETALKICLENLAIGNYSSVEFTIKILNSFNLQEQVTIQEIVASLLRKPRFQKIALAYKLIKENRLEGNFSFEQLYNFLLGKNLAEGFSLARQIVINDFKEKDKTQALMHICCIACKDGKLSKLSKQILFEDLKPSGDKYETITEYNGLVTGFYNNNYQIQFSNFFGSIDTPKQGRFYRKNSIVSFKFLEVTPRIEQSKITIINGTTLAGFISQFWFNNFYIGQILNFKVSEIQSQRAVMSMNGQQNLNLILPISEISHEFVTDISKFINANDEFEVQILRFDKKYQNIICSRKRLLLPKEKNVGNDNEVELTTKLKLLIEKYSK